MTGMEEDMTTEDDARQALLDLSKNSGHRRRLCSPFGSFSRTCPGGPEAPAIASLQNHDKGRIKSVWNPWIGSSGSGIKPGDGC